MYDLEKKQNTFDFFLINRNIDFVDVCMELVQETCIGEECITPSIVNPVD